ncbi:site-specific integrase [Arenibacter sp. BSSL-BM3]|uniref:Site-specific integrase n=1 Tax=Arenibacter arenosicollis TaxID=2762274 RepID=A0ABR7QQA3_9FLAO|nr:site-specific integrase [Arenibacter arenosicollis]MBC8769361.1 site-specific integrase [Arenibacter arenosicollis]
MATFYEIVTFEHKSEHVLEHNLSNKKNFSLPKIYTAKGDLSKRWYVYFTFRNPKTQKLERMKNVYGKANLYKTKEDRLAVLTVYRRNLLKLLREGYDPFKNNNDLHNTKKDQISPENQSVSQVSTVPTQSIANQLKKVAEKSLKEAFDYGLNLKKHQVNDRTFQDYGYKINRFLLFIAKHNPQIKTIDQLNKKMVLDFLNDILVTSSPRNRNNFRLILGSIMQTLEENEVMPINHIKNIKVLKSIPERNKTYSLEMESKIFDYLEKEDPMLLLYIKFISYNYLRPIEVCRLTIGDIDLENNTLRFKAKNSLSKTKIIPEILLEDLPDLSQMDKSHLLFTPDRIGGEWETTETNRRDYFSKRFKKMVKSHFNLNMDYGLYSFRHTSITKLYRMLLKNASPFEAKSKLMLITGHNSMVALQKYLRDIDAELPEDYSNLLK